MSGERHWPRWAERRPDSHLLDDGPRDHEAEAWTLRPSGQRENAGLVAARDATDLICFEHPPIGREREAGGPAETKPAPNASTGLRFLRTDPDLCAIAHAVMKVVPAHRASLGSDLESEVALAHAREQIGGKLEPSRGVDQAGLREKRGEQRMGGFEGGLPPHGPPFAAKSVRYRLVEEERVVMALVRDELVAETQKPTRPNLPHDMS